VGELVGATGATKLASIVQLDPIYVTFNVSEQDLLKVRTNLDGRRLTLEEIQKVPIEIGLMDEEGFPHRGTLNYVAPEIDPQTATILVRGIFANPNRELLPGFFVRVRMPMGAPDQNALLVPDRVIGQNQEGRYVLVVGANDEVEQRRVQLGQLQGALRVIASGVHADDRVVVTATDRAIPGRKVAPEPAAPEPAATAAAPPN
jgi:RND family efflux transporter MFP subunit